VETPELMNSSQVMNVPFGDDTTSESNLIVGSGETSHAKVKQEFLQNGFSNLNSFPGSSIVQITGMNSALDRSGNKRQSNKKRHHTGPYWQGVRRKLIILKDSSAEDAY
jgi:hypothetical protein